MTFASILAQIFVAARYATKGEEIKELETRKKQLLVENLILKKEIAEATNYKYLKENADQNGFVLMTENQVRRIE